MSETQIRRDQSISPSHPQSSGDVSTEQRHALINEAMVTAAQLQVLVDQVRSTTRHLADMLAVEVLDQLPSTTPASEGRNASSTR